MTESRLFEITGTVQGVGFRPFVWRLATRHRLQGWVRNCSGLVEIHAEGEAPALDAFASAIEVEAPTLAHVETVTWHAATLKGLTGFEVSSSVDVPSADRLVSPDAATCSACLTELFDPDDRRFRYPFINCTDCGPRFTIIDELPYDRERTSMRAFEMCADCRREYEDASDRRFHAEPIACPTCGPRLQLASALGGPLDDPDVIAATADLLRSGAIVALKGLGGFHLACDATDEETVARLRERKRRPDKPLAVMVADPDSARGWFNVSPPEVAALDSWRAPIVLVGDRGRLAPSVAPGYRQQGVMLPSTPLHHLLMRCLDRPLVMTSGNSADEPICTSNDEAIARLRGVADAFVLHDRDVVARYDDPVVRVLGGHPTVLRRARSYAPSAVRLPMPAPRPVLGVGAELHGAFCLASGDRAFLSQHMGNLDTADAMREYVRAVDRYRALFRIEPEAVAHDLHPDFFSTRFAEELGLEVFRVQHHHAHVVATMAEHRLEGTVLGLAFDGFGLG
ncbi:MAG: carbamoyltransferase HypF, partial [Actinobacteria bacterium]|nr:carbamoyltransferase HypF [Actinomycetota bacterium]